MKNFAALMLCFLLVSTLTAQKNPQSYLARIPSLPGNVCSMKASERQQYMDKVQELADELNNEISTRTQTVENNFNNSEEKAKQSAANQYGLSSSDIQKLSGNNLTEEQKMAIVNKAMQNKHNVSLDESKNLSNMSEEGRKAWAEAYEAEQMANAEGDKESVEKGNKKKMNTYELTKEKESLMRKIMASGKKISDRMDELEKQDQASLKELKDVVNPLCEKVSMGIGTPDNEVIGKIRAYQKKYCEEMSSSYFKILEERLVSLKTLLPDVKRLEEVSAKLNGETLGKSKKLSPTGLSELQAINSYVTELKSVFKYRISVCSAVGVDE